MVGPSVALIAEIPENVRDWNARLKHRLTTGKIVGEGSHVAPPSLPTHERSTDVAPSERGAWRKPRGLRIMGERVEHEMRDAFGKIHVRVVLVVAQLLVP